jgi:hypothetical protein
MRIFSDFKDYYDFAGYAVRGGGYKEVVYLRKTELKIADAVLYAPGVYSYYWQYNEKPTADGRWLSDLKIISEWWIKNKKQLSLPCMPKTVRTGCLFVCGRAYPFIFLRGTAQVGADGKCGQIKFSKHFNEAVKDGIAKEKPKYYRRREYGEDEEDFNFFKIYYTAEEFFCDVTVAHCDSPYGFRWSRADDEDLRRRNERDLKRFFDFYEGKDFTALHLRLDCPIALTLFEHKEGVGGNLKTEYEFLVNPNLYELDFMRVVSGDIMLQELDMFLGNVLVKDVMPPSYQSDIDKITAHGFDPKNSFRNTKDKNNFKFGQGIDKLTASTRKTLSEIQRTKNNFKFGRGIDKLTASTRKILLGIRRIKNNHFFIRPQKYLTKNFFSIIII